MNNTGYVQGSKGASSHAGSVDHDRLKQDYTTYLTLKNEEIKEQQDARRYTHGAQYTADQIKTYNKRKQPVVTFNRIGRKIYAIVGLLERQRQDPRGFPRTPKHEEGAEIATAVLRYVCDEQEWAEKSPQCGFNAAVDGIAGVELLLEPTDRGDHDLGFDVVDPSGFFYDPRSLKYDFSDARYMGVGKWADIDAAIEMFPEKEAEIRAYTDSGSDLTSNPDHESKWLDGAGSRRRVRIVDHWYIQGGQWRYCVYTGATILDEGLSPFIDEKGRTFCKYIMFSSNVDHDGDRYGFVRNMRSSQDEINMRRSKGLHILNSRRLIIAKGQLGDVEKVRREAARPDGVIEYEPGTEPPQFDDTAKNNELMGQLNFLQDAKTEIENYGFNPSLIGTGVDKMSGRAIQLQQQAGVAELGPFLLAFKGWKLRVYRAIWNAVQRFWSGERWIRVTDDENVAQFLQINQVMVDPVTGPIMVNALGSLDVDIIIDEGPDTMNMMQDTNQTLVQILPAIAPMLTPPLAQAALKMLVDTSDLPQSAKQRFREVEEKANQPNPMAQKAQMLQMAGAEAEVQDRQAAAILKQAQARKALADAGAAGMTGEQGPSEIEIAKALAEIRHQEASTGKVYAETQKIQVETALKPVEMGNQQREQEMSRHERFAFKDADMQQAERAAAQRQNAAA